MSVVVGYVATKEGRAALRKAAEECELRKTKLIVINSQRGGKDFDSEEALRFKPRPSWRRCKPSSPAQGWSMRSASWSEATSRPRT